MALELRPMRGGELLDRTFSILRQRFLFFASLILLPAAAGLLLPLPFLPHNLPAGTGGIAAALPYMLAIGVGFGLIVFPATMGATAVAVSGLARGETASLREVWLKTGKRIPGLFVATLLMYLAVSGAGVVFVAPIFVFSILGGLKGSAAIVALTVGLALTIAAGAFAVWVAAGLSLTQILVVLEGAGPLTALRRSWQLMPGGRWRVVFVYVLFLVISVVFKFVCMIPVTMMIAVSMRHGGSPFWLLLSSNWAGMLCSVVLVPLLGIGLTLEYFNQRIQKEAFDLEMMMNSLGASHDASHEQGNPVAGAEPMANG